MRLRWVCLVWLRIAKTIILQKLQKLHAPNAQNLQEGHPAVQQQRDTKRAPTCFGKKTKKRGCYASCIRRARKETCQRYNSTMGPSRPFRRVKFVRKNFPSAPRSNVWTQRHWIPGNDNFGTRQKLLELKKSTTRQSMSSCQ